jgi:hypothetical protein
MSLTLSALPKAGNGPLAGGAESRLRYARPMRARSPATVLTAVWCILAAIACSKSGLEDLCSAACDCESCDDADRTRCLDDASVRETAARNDCEPQYDDWIACVADDGSCETGRYDADACREAEAALQACVCVGLFHTPPRVGQCLI